MIRFDNVHKQYPDGTRAVDGHDFEVEEGTTTVLVGPSGCGKTTTMRLVNRLEEPTEGTIYYDGTDIEDLEATDLRREIGYVIQDIGLFDHMTVGENVATVPELKGWETDRTADRVDELLELMGLPSEEFRDSYPGELSGGQQQRVGVARGMGMTDWEILRKVQLPLALPVIFGGIRTSTVLNVGTAYLAYFISAGGLGVWAIGGIQLFNTPRILAGAFAGAALAIALDGALALVERRLGNDSGAGQSAAAAA